MNRTTGEKFDIREEIRVVPGWAIVAGALLFVGVQALFLLVLFRREHHPPPLAIQVPLAFMASSILGMFVLLIGYVNRDAKRRGMNSALWTVLVIFIPNAIGYIIYFLVRQPLRVTCPQCGAMLNPAFNFCPKCRFNLRPACPECHRSIELGTAYCPHCSAALKG